MSSRSSRASFFSTSLMVSPPRRKFHSFVSLGSTSSLMISAVRMRMSLMRSSSVAIGLTFMGMARPRGSILPRRYSPALPAPSGKLPCGERINGSIGGADVDAVGGVQEVGAGVAVADELRHERDRRLAYGFGRSLVVGRRRRQLRLHGVDGRGHVDVVRAEAGDDVREAGLRLDDLVEQPVG